MQIVNQDVCGNSLRKNKWNCSVCNNAGLNSHMNSFNKTRIFYLCLLFQHLNKGMGFAV